MKYLITALAAAAMLAGSSPGALAQQVNITAHTGAQGGMYMETVVVWADLWNKQIPNLRVSPILGSSVGNALKLNNEAKGNDMLGVIGTPEAVAAKTGTGAFKERAPNGLHDIRTLYRYNVVSYFKVLARGDALPAGVTSFRGLLDKKPRLRWVFHERGNVGQTVADRVLAGYGVSAANFLSWGGSTTYVSHAAMGEQMINGQADVALEAARAPASFTLDMDASVKNLKWLTHEPAALDKVAAASGGSLLRGILPTGIYRTQPGPYESVGYDHIVLVHKNMSDEVAYNLTRLVLTHAERFGNAIPALKSFDPKVVCKDVGPWPLHPGAERACRETGNL